MFQEGVIPNIILSSFKGPDAYQLTRWGAVLLGAKGPCAVGAERALVPPWKAEWSLSGEPKATGNTFLLLSFYL